MIEIVSEKQIELEAQKKKQKIIIDKSMKNGPFEIRVKPIKLNQNEMKKLHLKNGNLNIITLAYYRDDGTKDEVVLGNLADIKFKEGQNDINEYMHMVNSRILKIYNEERPNAVANQVTNYMNVLKNSLEKYKTEYTPEGYQFLKNYEQIYKGKKSVSVIENPEGFDNIEVYDNIIMDSRFNPNDYYEKHKKVEGTFIENLKQATNDDMEIATNIQKYEEYKDYSEIQKYIEDLKEPEQVAKFFENNVDMLNYIISTNPELQGVLENIRADKVPSKDTARRVLADAALGKIKKAVKEGNLEYIKMVIKPEEVEVDPR